jgi:hypothetical protein
MCEIRTVTVKNEFIFLSVFTMRTDEFYQLYVWNSTHGRGL